MAKILEDNKASSSKEFINRSDYEYLRNQTFTNVTLIVAAISVYATFAYITISYLKK